MEWENTIYKPAAKIVLLPKFGRSEGLRTAHGIYVIVFLLFRHNLIE